MYIMVRSKVTAKSTANLAIYVKHFLSLSFLSFKLPESCRIGGSSNLVIMEMTLEKKIIEKYLFFVEKFDFEKKLGIFSDKFRFSIVNLL